MTMLTVEVPQTAPADGAGETRAHVSQGTVAGAAPARPQRSRPTPPPAAPAPSPALAGATTQPFGRYQASTSQRRRKAATRLWLPQVLTYAAVAGTAAGLIIYFA